MSFLDKKKVVIGMSGGVDSSVAAYILQQQGYDVIGVTMKLWTHPDESQNMEDTGCCGLSAVDDARRVANQLGIPYYVMNFKEPFRKKVVDYFIHEYLAGRTPNPCIACNRFIKFEELLKKAHALGAYYVATGHYSKIVYDEKINKYLIKKSNAAEKDQTYVLYNFTQEQLRHTLMPLGDFHSKEEVREIASKIGLNTALKPESQEICFIPDNDYGRFIVQEKPEEVVPGNFIDKNGKILGRHKGIANYTIGQRKGLGIALGKPVYVIDILPETNEVVLGENEDLFGTELIAEDVNLIFLDHIEEGMEVMAKIRYHSEPAFARLYPDKKNQIRVVFAQPQRAITPGQAVVFYLGDILVGGGTIAKRVK